MKVIAFGDIMDGGNSVFTSVARLDGNALQLSFEGVIRIDNPYNHLRPFLDELKQLLPTLDVNETHIDFTNLRFCNSNGFYIIMDITEAVYEDTKGEVYIKRLREDDWQQETLPILIDYDEPHVEARTSFIEHNEL